LENVRKKPNNIVKKFINVQINSTSLNGRFLLIAIGLIEYPPLPDIRINNPNTQEHIFFLKHSFNDNLVIGLNESISLLIQRLHYNSKCYL